MRAPAVTFLLSALGYALMLCGSPYWLDSGELAAGSFELGVAHAPGQPLAMLVGKLFCFLPLGDVSLRVGLGQLFCGAGAAAVVAWLGRRVATSFVDDRLAAEALGVAAGLAYAASTAAGFQAIRPEVYALSALLVLSAIACCVRWDDERDPRWLGGAGLLAGLGLTNHHYLTVLGLGPPALALLARRPDAPMRRGLGLAVLGGGAALLLYAYLPLRAAHDPIVDWGHPTSPSAFWWTVTARSFQKSVGLTRRDDVLSLIETVFGQLTPLAPVLALGGLYLLLRRARRTAAWLLLAILGPIGARLVVPFDAGNPDALAYLSTGIAALALLCVPVPAAVAGALPAAGRRALAVGVAISALALGVARAPAYSLAGFEDTRAIYHDALAELPADAVVVPSYFQTAFSLEYLRAVEGWRPDASYLPRHFLDQPGVPAALLRRDPRLAPLVREGALDVDALLAAHRPLFVEYDLDLDPRLLPAARVIPVPRVPVEAQSRRFGLWQAFLDWHRLCRLGAPPALLTRAEHTVRRFAGPGDAAEIDALRAACPGLRGR